MSSSLPAVLAWHQSHYPLLRATDIYKLIHQGVFGPGHIIDSAASVRRMLQKEVAALQVRSPKDKGRRPEPDVEPLAPNNSLVRVNLRPLFGERGRTDTDWLVTAMVESARRVKGEPQVMKRWLAAAVRWCRGNLPRQAAELERMAGRAEESGFPPFHHSSAYARAYRPAYRVILSGCLKLRVSGKAGRAGRQNRAAVSGGR